MKKILLDENKSFYKANMHCHSTKSDGENEVEFEFLPDDIYIRFDVVDKHGKRANTNAYFI